MSSRGSVFERSGGGDVARQTGAAAVHEHLQPRLDGGQLVPQSPVRPPGGAQGSGGVVHVLDPILDIGVAVEVGGNVVRVTVALLEDPLEEASRAGGVVAGAGHEDRAALVRLGLELAAEAKLHGHVDGLTHDQGTGLARGHGGGHAGEAREQVGRLGLLRHAQVVAALHVGDLVTHHTGQLVDAAHRQQGAAVEVDVAAGQGEGIEAGVFDHAKAVDEGLGLDPC